MTEQQIQLRKPKFIKLNQIQPGDHGYNVYVKIVKVENIKVPNGEGGEKIIAKVTVGDSTSLANATFINPQTDIIKQGQVIAIRNGRANVVKQQIQLGIDLFGRITKQTENVDATGVTNLSDKKWIIDRQNRRLPPRRFRGGRRNFNTNRDREEREDRVNQDRPVRRPFNRDNDRNRNNRRDERGYERRNDRDNKGVQRNYDRGYGRRKQTMQRTQRRQNDTR